MRATATVLVRAGTRTHRQENARWGAASRSRERVARRRLARPVGWMEVAALLNDDIWHPEHWRILDRGCAASGDIGGAHALSRRAPSPFGRVRPSYYIFCIIRQITVQGSKHTKNYRATSARSRERERSVFPRFAHTCESAPCGPAPASTVPHGVYSAGTSPAVIRRPSARGAGRLTRHRAPFASRQTPESVGQLSLGRRHAPLNPGRCCARRRQAFYAGRVYAYLALLCSTISSPT